MTRKSSRRDIKIIIDELHAEISWLVSFISWLHFKFSMKNWSLKSKHEVKKISVEKRYWGNALIALKGDIFPSKLITSNQSLYLRKVKEIREIPTELPLRWGTGLSSRYRVQQCFPGVTIGLFILNQMLSRSRRRGRGGGLEIALIPVANSGEVGKSV